MLSDSTKQSQDQDETEIHVAFSTEAINTMMLELAIKLYFIREASCEDADTSYETIGTNKGRHHMNEASVEAPSSSQASESSENLKNKAETFSSFPV